MLNSPIIILRYGFHFRSNGLAHKPIHRNSGTFENKPYKSYITYTYVFSCELISFYTNINSWVSLGQSRIIFYEFFKIIFLKKKILLHYSYHSIRQILLKRYCSNSSPSPCVCCFVRFRF